MKSNNHDHQSPNSPGASRYHGFSLDSVCWGYRDIFKDTIERLLDEKLVGFENERVSRQFFELLKKADRSCFDHVLKEFLGAMNPRTRWIMSLPGIFSDITILGRELAESKLYHGMWFFRLLGEGGLGDTPSEVRALIDHMRMIREVDEDLACGFMRGYRKLMARLTPEEISLYVGEGIRLFRGRREHGIKFMEGVTSSSENIIRSITRESRLEDVHGSLSMMLRALVGYEVEVSDLGKLDSDELMERGSTFVCMYRWVYMPLIIRYFRQAEKNRQWYLLMMVVAAGMLCEDSFCRIHGHPRYPTCRSLVGDGVVKLNLFQLVEYTRVLNSIRCRWPGVRRLIKLGLETEFREMPPRSPADRLLSDCLSEGHAGSATVAGIKALAEKSINVFETASLLSDSAASDLSSLCPELGSAPLRTIGFMPDFLFPAVASAPPPDSLVADLRDEAERHTRDQKDADEARAFRDVGRSGQVGRPEEREKTEPRATFVYDEWSQPENDYYRDYCQLREIEVAASSKQVSGISGYEEETRRIRQTFERLKPDMARKEKRLPDGETINTDILVDYLTSKHLEPDPRVEFYEKPLINRRDLAVLVLLDVSGSTGDASEGSRVLDIEKRAALIFGEGLDSLGDHFSVCGFSGNGRANCEYFVYKDFRDPWSSEAISRLFAAGPRSSTRIGAALRHSGHRISSQEHGQRLIILITDGKPMDEAYEPGTRYAQYDVRKACEENLRGDIKTFAISTIENTRADMEIMFPGRRFAILPDLSSLPRILPELYVRMTV